MREKRPWYVWMSLLGVVYLLALAWWELGRRGADGRSLLSFLGEGAYLLAGQCVLPAVVLLGVWRRIPWAGPTAAWLGLMAAGALIYGAGVLAAIRLDRLLRGTGE